MFTRSTIPRTISWDGASEQVAAALERLEFDTPSGKIRMAIGKGHQAIEPTVYGRARTVNGKLTFTDVKQYPAEKVNPPDGVKSVDWIKSGFKASM